MGRRKRRTIPQIHRHGAHHDSGTVASPGPDDVLKILREMAIHGTHARIVGLDLLVEEHFHSAPLAFSRWRLLNFSAKGVNELSGARGFQGEIGMDQRQRRCLLAENRPGTERSDDFIVAHVNYPDVATGGGAITGNRKNNVRVDSCHCSVHHFKARAGITQFQHGLQHVGQAKTGLRITEGRRFTKNKNSHCAGRLDLWNKNRKRRPCHLRPEEAPAELIILNKPFLSVVQRRQQERCRITKTSKSQN